MPGLFQSALNNQLNNTNTEENRPSVTNPVMPRRNGQRDVDANPPQRPKTYEEEVAARGQIVAQNDAIRESDLQQAELRTAIAQMQKAEAAAREANSPEAAQAAQILLQKAKVDLATAQLALAKAQDPSQHPEYIARLEAELAQERDRVNAEHQAALQDARLKAEIDQINATQDRLDQRSEKDNSFTAEQNRLTREAQTESNRLTAGIQVRGQELEKLKAEDNFTLQTIANQLQKGQIGVDRAYKILQTQIEQKKLPSEIMRNVGQAIAPMVPYLSAYKAGEIPVGFESGGPFETALRHGGATSYDPSVYAAKPVGIDIFSMAKKAGADFNTPKLSNPETYIPNVDVNVNPTSAMANLPTSLQMTPEIEQLLNGALNSLGRGGVK